MALAKQEMPYTKIWIHIIWTTKNRENIIPKEIKSKLLDHIKKNASSKDIYVDSLNCTQDHIHLLIFLGREQTISKNVMLLKGESSHWVNKNKLVRGKFKWQDEYIAVSVSESAVNKVRKYISNQMEHHRTKSLEEEYKFFLEKYGFG